MFLNSYLFSLQSTIRKKKKTGVGCVISEGPYLWRCKRIGTSKEVGLFKTGKEIKEQNWFAL